jgi:hypothetical protein
MVFLSSKISSSLIPSLLYVQDFSFQRRQLLEGITEQEKDVRLYEQICKSVLTEKDLKRVCFIM